MEQGDWGLVEDWQEEPAVAASGAAAEDFPVVEPSYELPLSGRDVRARVVKVQLQEVRCEVLAIDGRPLFVPCRGVIRYTDVMALGIDRYDLLDCFRPGDIVRAALVATGLSKSYLLTTTPVECGVIEAKSRCCRAPMLPTASSLMRCSNCQGLEYRVVAKPSSCQQLVSEPASSARKHEASAG